MRLWQSSGRLLKASVLSPVASVTWLCRAEGGHPGSFWAGRQHLWAATGPSIPGASLHHRSA